MCHRYFSNCLFCFFLVFIRHTLNASDFEKKLLLERLYELEEYMKHGLLVASKFLSDYLLLWNSVDHRRQILNLIKWATFSSYTGIYIFLECLIYFKFQI